MMKSDIWGGNITRKRSISWRFSFEVLTKVIVPLIVLLLLGVLGMRLPSLMTNSAAERAVQLFSPALGGLLIGAMIMAPLVILQQYELAAAIIIVVSIYVDWFWGLDIVAQTMALGLLLLFFLTRSSRHRWIVPRALWLWLLFLALAISPAIRGALRFQDVAFYYPNIILGALLMFWLGSILAEDVNRVKRFFQILAAVGALLAIHTIIQARTGTVLFETAQNNQYIGSIGGYLLNSGTDVYRSGSFFTDPNWNGTFFATLLFLPLGLFVMSSSPLEKALYLAEMLLMLPALLFTYSNGAWLGAFAGTAAFLVFVGSIRYRVLLSFLIVLIALVAVVYFPAQLDLQLQHALGYTELSSRVAAWQTALNVIAAFPLTGIGLGLQAYLQRAEPYRVAAQYEPLAHPHNSYLELGAMAGLPLLAVFVALLLYALWQALGNWRRADGTSRGLLSGGIASIIALSVNSFGINGWTLPPLAATGWLILGVIASPLLTKSRNSEMEQEQSNNLTGHSS